MVQQGTAMLDNGEALADVERDTVWAGVSADDKAKLLAAVALRNRVNATA